MNIFDHVSGSLETIFWVTIIIFFDADADPGSGNLCDPRSEIRNEKKLGSGMEKIRIRDKHLGSAILPGTHYSNCAAHVCTFSSSAANL
jgi:hypothetical protein